MTMIEYKKMNLHQHVLARPDTYVGSIRNQEYDEYIVTDDLKIEKNRITYIPALLRIFIEALSNAIDNKWRSDEQGIPFKTIKITINQETGETSIWNDGLAIPIRKNDKDVWIPEMIFGQLLTSSNYNDQEDRYVSGRNGLGIKLNSLFSSVFKIKLVDNVSGQSYSQKWSKNMSIVGKPRISKSTGKGFTEVSWIPDFHYFGIDGYTKELVTLFTRYACDAAMLTGVNVTMNGKRLPIKGLKDYAKLYTQPEFRERDLLVLNSKDCQVVLAPSNEFQHVSFTNGVYTSDGGVHVDTWQEAIFKPLCNKLNSKSKNIKLTMKDVKQYFRLFVVCSVPNPEFTSQSKTCMSAPKVSTNVTTSNINSLMKWEFVTHIEEMIKAREMLSLRKSERKSRGNKPIEGYDPANRAGKESSKCSLILCEGLSAKTFAVTGMQQGLDFGDGLYKGRDYMGVYALRGKLLNTRNASITSIAANKEISSIIQILGLEHNVDYSIKRNFEKLRYARIIILCDADVDGFHIEALILNMIDHLFPSLLAHPKFVLCMQTPVMKIQSKNTIKRFYDLQQAYQYIETHSNAEVKYYKGLGTSSDKDVLDTFGKRMIVYQQDDSAITNINKAFNKDFAGARKKWLEEYKEHEPEYTPSEMSHIYGMKISDFINSKLIQFSIDDCKRSLPHLMDGLKESHRKVLFACFLKNLTDKTLKVAQLAGFVAEKTNYHHGEQCLHDTITKMAQTFVGSNNIPLLDKDGQFGTRLESGGKDAANARYILTKLKKTTRLIFRKEDDPILTYKKDDGDSIEPEFYVPIIPMILVNGGDGIGTGWSCSIPSYNPLTLIDWIHAWLNDNHLPELCPWYNGFKGTIESVTLNKYSTRGLLERKSSKCIVHEIPVGNWINPYKEFLENLVDQKKIKRLINHSTPDQVHFEFTEVPDKMKCNENTLKLVNTLSTTNLVLFNDQGRLKKYSSITDIMNEFCSVRLHYYKLRIEHTIETLTIEYNKVKSKHKFLTLVMKRELNLFESKEEELVKEFKRLNLVTIEDSYDYLLSLPVRSFTLKRTTQLKETLTRMKNEIKLYKTTTPITLWKKELKELKSLLN